MNFLNTLLSNPIIIGVISGILSGVLVGIIIYNLYEKIKKDKVKIKVKDLLDNANKLLENNDFENALFEYNRLLKEMAGEGESEIFSKIKFQEGICYYYSSFKVDKEINLNNSIRAYEEALKIFTLEKYPLLHKKVIANLEKTR